MFDQQKAHSKWVKPKYWRGFFWLHSLALFVDGLLYLLSFGFYWADYDMKFIFWQAKREIRKRKERGFE